MFEARLQQGAMLKKIIEAVKELVSDANFDCNDSGLSLQAMDSHVALTSLLLRADGFDPYRCDRNLSLGVNLQSLSKVLKSAGNDDIVTLKANESADVLNMVFESQNLGRISEYDLKLMNIDTEHLGIPESDFDATVRIPSSEFQRICRDLAQIGESILIQVKKDSVVFTAEGEFGNGSVTLKHNASIDEEDDSSAVMIELNESVALSFSLKFLNIFTKATSLSQTVALSMTNGVPMMIEYKFDDIGYLRYYLAPKIDDDE